LTATTWNRSTNSLFDYSTSPIKSTSDK